MKAEIRMRKSAYVLFQDPTLLPSHSPSIIFPFNNFSEIKKLLEIRTTNLQDSKLLFKKPAETIPAGMALISLKTSPTGPTTN